MSVRRRRMSMSPKCFSMNSSLGAWTTCESAAGGVRARKKGLVVFVDRIEVVEDHGFWQSSIVTVQ
jgi:hypothetical protein